MSNQPRMVSGIQPTNKITLGNYLGAIKNFVKFQDEYEMYVFIADLHAITTNTVSNIAENKLSVAKTYLAAGLDPSRVVIFNQSDVQEHTMLGYILTCNTTIGELNRMTQFKDKSVKCKSANGTEFIPTGLLIYPALMAADILLYDANFVIVGQDQKQHLELTRNIAIRVNNATKSELFTVPEFKTGDFSAKIMDLLDPTKKMSKSSENPKGTIFIDDDIEVTRKKIMGSLTDNLNKVKYDWDNQPGVSNLISIYASITEKSIPDIEKEFNDIPNYGVFKKAVADVVCDLIKSIQDKMNKYSNKEINDILTEGANKAKKIASVKVQEVLKKTGMK